METSAQYYDRDRLSYVEAMSSLKLKPILLKMGIAPPKLPATTSKLQDHTRQRPRGKIELRTKVVPYTIPKVVQQCLFKKDYDEYQPESLGSTRREKANRAQEDLNEKNPYCTPAGGITHKFRAAMEIIEKVYKKYEANRPLHQRPNSSFRIRTNVNNVLQKVLGPEESILPTKLNLLKKKKGEFDFVNPALAIPRPKTTEYVSCWKEIELCNILKGYKLKEMETIDNEMREDESAYNSKKTDLMNEANKLEEFLLENECEATTATHHLHDVKDILGKKDEQIKALNKKVGDLHRAIDKTLVDLDGLQIIQFFIFQMSPITWRNDFDYLTPIEEGTKKKLLSLYSKKGLGDEITGDYSEDMMNLESLNEFEEKHKKCIYFEKTHQLLDALEHEEETNLSMIQDDLNFETRIGELRVKFDREIKDYDIAIKAAETMVVALYEKVDFEENHAKGLEIVTKMYGMGTEYQEYERTLMLNKIKVQTRKAYFEIIGVDAPGYSMLNQLMEIEKKYAQLLDEIDFLASYHEDDLKAKIIAEEKRIMLEEDEIVRKLAEFQQLSVRMARALAPPPTADERCRRLVKSRASTPHKGRSAKSKSSANSPATTRPRGTGCDSLESLSKLIRFEF